MNPVCTQPCKRTGTLQSSFCPHDFGELRPNETFKLPRRLLRNSQCLVFFLSPSLLPPVITGKVTAVLPGPSSAKVEVSLIKAYKAGRLNVTKSGPAMSITLTSTCKRCPGLAKGTAQRSLLVCRRCDCIYITFPNASRLSPSRPELRVDGKRGRSG